MKKSNLVFGSILSGVGVLYGLNLLGIVGNNIFSMAFVVLIIILPVLTEQLKVNSNLEYIVKGIFAGCLLLSMFVKAGLVFEVVIAVFIVISGIVMIFFDSLKKLFKSRDFYERRRKRKEKERSIS